MKRLLIVGLVGAIAIPANAQTSASGTGMNSPNYSTYQSSVESINGLGSSETPSMRAQKLDRAKALKAEAKMLLKQDGGKLTLEHNAYIRGKACEILGYGRTGTGGLVPRHRCE
jgi:hypothetical protein